MSDRHGRGTGQAGHGPGFQSVTRLAEARERLLALIDLSGRTETVSPGGATDRVLAEAVDASRPVPHFERAAMDGYAVRATDTHGAAARSPRELTTAADAVSAGEAVRVQTGEPLPDGADAVVMIERCEERDGTVAVTEAVAPGENVSAEGEDVQAGRRLFEPGRRLDPADVALLRATGVGTVTVREAPTATVIPTGEELVAADPARGEVVETNGTMVAGLIEEWGGRAKRADIVTDDFERLRDAIEAATDSDLIVTTGGSSVGDRDLLPDLVAERGDLVVHGVAIKPGHPVGFGTVAETPIVVLPGYPVSAFVGAVQLVRPAVATAGGFDPPPIQTTECTLASKVASEPGERTFARVRSVDSESVEPIRVAGASVLSSVTDADGWVVVPEQVEGYAAGESVTVERWQWAR